MTKRLDNQVEEMQQQATGALDAVEALKKKQHDEKTRFWIWTSCLGGGGLFLLGTLIVVGLIGYIKSRPVSPSVATSDPNFIYTQAAQTVEVLATQNSPTLAPPPTSIPPTTFPTPNPIPCDQAVFISETIPDGTAIKAGTTFTKTWTFQNNGSCTWDKNYRLVFFTGDAMGAPPGGSNFSAIVPPGGTIVVQVILIAPKNAGSYQGYFKLQNASGVQIRIGDNTNNAFWVKVKVGS